MGVGAIFYKQLWYITCFPVYLFIAVISLYVTSQDEDNQHGP